MKVGTKSLLFGIHQFIWHPILVTRAWVYLYRKFPTFKEFICIVIHDWGYWGKPNLDGPEGIEHPLYGAKLAQRLFGDYYWALCAGHSRSYIELVNNRWGYDKYMVSKLCWADKLSFCFEPRWFYIFRAKLSGEWKLVMEESLRHGFIDDVNIQPNDWHKLMFQYSQRTAEIGRLNLKWEDAYK